jgi:hypothetical protein
MITIAAEKQQQEDNGAVQEQQYSASESMEQIGVFGAIQTRLAEAIVLGSVVLDIDVVAGRQGGEGLREKSEAG